MITEDTNIIMEKHTEREKYCVILAGGRGRRLWPCSREEYPKQFMDFFGMGKTQLQLTFERFAKIVPKSHIMVCTNKDFASIVKEQLPELSDGALVAEPISRNTAPSVAAAVCRICKQSPEAVVVVTPSDQFVLNENAFAEDINEGLEFVSVNNKLLTLGVTPTRPEPGYGYIQMGESDGSKEIFQVRSFTEKPERDFAKVFVESGEFLWNTGLFLGSAEYFCKRFVYFFPEASDTMARMTGGMTLDNGLAFINDNYAAFPNLSIDNAVLETSENVCVMKCYFGWADLGTWHSIYECLHRGFDDNVVIDSQVMMENCKGNVIKLPKGKLAVLNGLEGYIVAEHDNVLLICKKGDTSGLMRKYVNEVQLKYGDDYI